MMKKTASIHKSRFKRAEDLPGLILQDRDIQILAACYQFRYLTRPQIQRLFDMNCVTRVNIRLRKLFDHRYLDRRFLPTPAGALQTVYLLGLNGISAVSGLLGLDTQEVARNRTQNMNIKTLALGHDMIMNNFRISVTKEIERDGRSQLKRWLDPRDCEQIFEINEGGKTFRASLRPDGFFQLSFEGKIYSFFVEMDLSTSNHAKLASKFTGYIQFQKLGLSSQAFGIQNFYVLVVAKTSERRDNLKILLAACRFTSFEK